MKYGHSLNSDLLDEENDWEEWEQYENIYIYIVTITDFDYPVLGPSDFMLPHY